MYSQAHAFVFPSLYEGFGLPILEAMQCGCPVIAYNTSSIPEVAGDAAILVDPSSALRDKIALVLENTKVRDRLSRAGLAQARKFNWERTAKETIKALELS